MSTTNNQQMNDDIFQTFRKLFNSIDPIKLVEDAQKPHEATGEVAVHTGDMWKQWLRFFSSYNALAVAILIENSVKNKNSDKERLKSYRSLFRGLAYHGLLFKLSRTIFIAGSSLLVVSIAIAMLVSIKSNKNALDFLANRKFLSAVVAISLFLFVTLLICAFWKVYLEHKINQAESDAHVKITKEHIGPNTTVKVDIAIDAEEDILTRDNNDNNQQRIFKTKFSENFPSNILDRNDNNHYHIKDSIPLYKSGYCSKSGSYKFFYFSAILISLGIGLLALTTLYTQKNQQVAALTKNFLQNPKNIGYSILGCLLAFLVLYCVIRYGKQVFDGLRKFAEWAVKGLKELVMNLWNHVWTFLCFCGRGLRDVARRSWDFIDAGSDIRYAPKPGGVLETTTRTADNIDFNALPADL